ncbi:nucleotide sugar dehydrogenase [Congregibacter sp.]|jgi:UDP-N-acetyl-D-galactosamine dehydrogenase|uniref:nucleotide sugar dehydrogenase n=1 Tax=Congregibacter sp. TaxID=2744308 RepID=UPI0039E33EF4
MTETVAIVGLGYVGLPLAVAFGSRMPTVGFDINEAKLKNYNDGHDPSGEVSSAQLEAADQLSFTSDPSFLSNASIVIVVVPTPIDSANRPDLKPLQGATRIVAENLTPGATVIFESTVYPGCTEEVCVPILEEFSGLTWCGRDSSFEPESGFCIGYSPERINPGDKSHRLETIVKVVSGDSDRTLERVASLYECIITAGVYRAPSIKVAEAAKVIENTQRDLNIALMNELAMIFDRLDIDTLDVLEAAGTKWNFLPFRPGLVGGHCIGVDPYYLTYKAESTGFHPQVVLGGRKTNDSMGKFIAEQTVKQLASKGLPITGAKVSVFGLTFKENCPDLRNSRVPDIIDELRAYGCEVCVHDPIAKPEEALAEYGVRLSELEDLLSEPAHALILAVSHAEYLTMGGLALMDCVRGDGVVVDVKGIFDRGTFKADSRTLWRL